MIYLFAYLFAVIWGFIVWRIAALKTNRGKKLYLIPVFVLLILIAGLRGYTVGEDTGAYVGIFLKLCHRSVSDVAKETSIEEIHLYFMKFLTFFSKNPQIYLLITSMIIYVGLAKFFYDHSDNVCISMVLFLGLYFVGTMSVIRQYMAIAIACQSLNALKNRKYKAAVFFSLIALLAHKSAVIFWGIELLYVIHRKHLYLPLFFIGTVFTWFFYKSGLMLKFISWTPYAHYIGSKYMRPSHTGGTINIALFFITTMSLFFLLLLREYERREIGSAKDRKKMWFYLSMVIVNCMILTISRQYMLFMRFAMYFVIFLFLLIPAVFKETGRLRWIANASLILCMLGTTLITASDAPYSFFTMPI